MVVRLKPKATSRALPPPVLPMDASEYKPLPHTLEFVHPGDNRYWMYLLKCVTCHQVACTPWGIGSGPPDMARQMGWQPGKGSTRIWQRAQCPSCCQRQQQMWACQQSDQTWSQNPHPHQVVAQCPQVVAQCHHPHRPHTPHPNPYKLAGAGFGRSWIWSLIKLALSPCWPRSPTLLHANAFAFEATEAGASWLSALDSQGCIRWLGAPPVRGTLSAGLPLPGWTVIMGCTM